MRVRRKAPKHLAHAGGARTRVGGRPKAARDPGRPEASSACRARERRLTQGQGGRPPDEAPTAPCTPSTGAGAAHATDGPGGAW